MSCWRFPFLLLRRLWSCVCVFAAKVSNTIGVRGVYFEAAFLLRETIEITMQSIQCFNNSKFVSRAWLNQFSVALLVLNCWSTPTVYVLLQRHRRKTIFRCGCLAADVCFDLLSSLLLPSLVMWPYFVMLLQLVIDVPSRSLGLNWLVQAQSELRAVLFMSWSVMLAQFLPMLSSIQALEDIKNLLDCSPKIAPSSQVGRLTTSNERNSRNHNLHVLAHALFVLHGVVVIVLSTNAYSIGASTDTITCVLQLLPWLSDRASCAAIVVNCEHLQLRGDFNGINRVLEPLALTGVRSISFAHCPALQVPPIVTQMPDLFQFNIFNCTITQWDSSVAITATNLSMMGFISIVSSSFDGLQPARFPSALLHDDLPASLKSLRVTNSVIDVPDDFGAKWSHPLNEISIENCNLTTFPRGLLSIRNLDLLSLAGNAIREIPSEAFSLSDGLAINENPVIELPMVEPDKLQTKWLWMIETNISRLPHWVSKVSEIYVRGSPLCTSGVSSNITIDCHTLKSGMPDNMSEWSHQSGLEWK